MIKVWSIVIAQLALTSAMSCWAMVDKRVEKFMGKNLAIMIVAVVLAIIIFIAILCCRKVARKVPINYVCLLTFTVCLGYMVTFITTAYPPVIVF